MCDPANGVSAVVEARWEGVRARAPPAFLNSTPTAITPAEARRLRQLLKTGEVADSATIPPPCM